MPSVRLPILHFARRRRWSSRCTATVALAQTKPPVAPVKDVVDTHFGVEVHDPYRYMEDMKNPEVAAWMKAQADFTRGVLDRIPQRATLLAEVAEIRRRGGGARRRRRRSTTITSTTTSALPTRTSRSSTCARVSAARSGCWSIRRRSRARRTSTTRSTSSRRRSTTSTSRTGFRSGGSEQSVLHVKEVATGKETGDVIDRANFGPPGWTGDNRLLYNRLQKLAPDAPPTDKYVNSRVYLHTLGTDPEKDVAILGPGVTPGRHDATRSQFPFAGTMPGSRHAIGVVVQRRPARVRDLHGDARLARRRASPTGRRSSTPSDDVTDASADRRQPLRAHAQGRVALQGAEDSTSTRPISRRRPSSFRRASR